MPMLLSVKIYTVFLLKVGNRFWSLLCLLLLLFMETSLLVFCLEYFGMTPSWLYRYIFGLRFSFCCCWKSPDYMLFVLLFFVILLLQFTRIEEACFSVKPADFNRSKSFFVIDRREWLYAVGSLDIFQQFWRCEWQQYISHDTTNLFKKLSIFWLLMMSNKTTADAAYSVFTFLLF